MEIWVSRTLARSAFGMCTRLYGLTGFDCHAGVGLWETRSDSVLVEVGGTATFGWVSLVVPTCPNGVIVGNVSWCRREHFQCVLLPTDFS